MRHAFLLLMWILMVCALTACAAERQTNSCPPALTLGDKTDWEMGTAAYRARQEGGMVTITANGRNRSGGFKVQLAREPMKIFPPKFALYQKRPEGMATQAITPFTLCVSFKASQGVGAVMVRDNNGEHRVPVETAP